MAAKKKLKPTKIIIWSSLLLILTLIIAKQCNFIGSAPTTVVSLEQPQVRTITEIITANGRIQPEIEVKISPEVSGEIVELNIKEGDDMKKGDLLTRIKPDIYISIKERSEASLNATKASLKQVIAQLKQAELNFNRQKQLYEAKAISTAEFEQAEANRSALVAQKEQAQANIKASEAQLKQSIEDLQKTTLYAPSDGTISMLSVELGERVVGTATMAGTEMLRMANLSNMEVRAEVNENDIVRVALGDSATIEVDAYLGTKFKGVVTRIANSSIATASGAEQVISYEVRIAIDPKSYAHINTDSIASPFRPGMSSTVEIVTDVKTVQSLPIQAVTTRSIEGQREQVVFEYQQDSSLVKVRKVATGIQDKDYIELISGVDSSAKVVTAPFSVLSKTLNDSDIVTEDKPEDDKGTKSESGSASDNK